MCREALYPGWTKYVSDGTILWPAACKNSRDYWPVIAGVQNDRLGICHLLCVNARIMRVKSQG